MIAELCNITKTFSVAGSRELKVLDQIDLAIHEGELVGASWSIRFGKIDVATMSDRFDSADEWSSNGL